MADHVIHISEAEAASDFASVLARVRAGAEVVIESSGNSAMHSEMVRRGATGAWITATGSLPSSLSTAVMDADFAKDVEAAIESHREPLEPPPWD
jgi:hypothetical protein